MAKIVFGAVAAALLQFVLVGALIYFGLILPINWLRKATRRRASRGCSPSSRPTIRSSS